jgi:hypothetical protein
MHMRINSKNIERVSLNNELDRKNTSSSLAGY